MLPVSEIVDRIRDLCRQNKTSLTKLEEKFGWANGTIGKWKTKGKNLPAYDKLALIAYELGVSVAYLTGEEQKNAPTAESSKSEVDMKLREFAASASPEELLELHNYIEFIKSKRKP